MWRRGWSDVPRQRLFHRDLDYLAKPLMRPSHPYQTWLGCRAGRIRWQLGRSKARYHPRKPKGTSFIFVVQQIRSLATCRRESVKGNCGVSGDETAEVAARVTAGHDWQDVTMAKCPFGVCARLHSHGSTVPNRVSWWNLIRQAGY